MASPGYSHGYVSGVELVNLFCPFPIKVGIILTVVPFFSSTLVWRRVKRSMEQSVICQWLDL